MNYKTQEFSVFLKFFQLNYFLSSSIKGQFQFIFDLKKHDFIRKVPLALPHPFTHHGHIFGVARELSVEEEADTSLVFLPGVLQRGHVAAVFGPVLSQTRNFLPFKFL